ncbi:unnamed protein product, partial [Dovyalis caffra]
TQIIKKKEEAPNVESQQNNIGKIEGEIPFVQKYEFSLSQKFLAEVWKSTSQPIRDAKVLIFPL